MNAEVDKIVRKLYTNSRMELEFFMFLPSIISPITQNGTATLNYNPILNLRYKQNKNLREGFDFTKATYKITPRNLYQTIKFFNDIMMWFYDDKYESLFLMDENGKLIFNADFNKLSLTTKMGNFDSCILQAIPTIVRFGEAEYEGIHLYVNTSSYCIPLTYQEVGCVFDIIRNFSFTNEVTASLTAYQYAYNNKRFISIDSNSRYGLSGKTPFDN